MINGLLAGADYHPLGQRQFWKKKHGANVRTEAAVYYREDSSDVVQNIYSINNIMRKLRTGDFKHYYAFVSQQGLVE